MSRLYSSDGTQKYSTSLWTVTDNFELKNPDLSADFFGKGVYSMTNIRDAKRLGNKKFWDGFKEIIYRTYGWGNSTIALMLYASGADADALVNLLNNVPHGPGKVPAAGVVINPRSERKKRGVKPAKKTNYLLEKVRRYFPDDYTKELPRSNFLSGQTEPLAEYLRGCLHNPPEGVYAIPFISLLKMNETTRAAILANPTTKALLAKAKYVGCVPADLRRLLHIDDKTFVKKQVEVFHQELYALTQMKGGIPENAVSPINKRESLRTLSQIGYQNARINDSKSYALAETSRITLERIGLGIYHLPIVDWVVRDRLTRRGYNRLLQRINTVGKAYDKCLREGQTPEVARTVAKTQLEFWLSDGDHTDGKWRVFERKDWSPAVVEAKAKTPRKTTAVAAPRKKRKATVDDLLEMLADNNTKDNDNDVENTNE